MTFELSGIFFITPLPPAISTLFPILKCPEIPAWPPILTFSPIFELPANPTWPVIIQFFPISTLCAIWTWLSIKVFFPMIVFDKDPLSIVLLQPISTLSLIITMPMWGYLKFLFLSGKKPKPFFPIRKRPKFYIISNYSIFNKNIITNHTIVSNYYIWFNYSIMPIIVFFPIFTFFPINTLWPNLTFLNLFGSLILTDKSTASSIELGNNFVTMATDFKIFLTITGF